MAGIFAVFLYFYEILVLVCLAYYFIIAFFGLIDEDEVSDFTNNLNKFAIIIAAHNEERVISGLLDSLFGMDYPREWFDVFVIADNCSDRTALRAREAGAIVLCRVDEDKKSKGYALEYAFEHIFGLSRYDFVCIVDADNVVSTNFLTEMNMRANSGKRVIQGCIDSKNPFDSWLTVSYSLWYWISNRLLQLSRKNLNIGCRLGGTGSCIQTSLIKEMPWGTSLAEDTEFSLNLALHGIKIDYAHKAVVYDEKPLVMSCSIKQRKRWIQGNFGLAARFVKPLLLKAIRERQFEPIHTILGLCAAPIVIVSAISWAIMYSLTVLSIVNDMNIIGNEFWITSVGFFILSAFFVCGLILIIGALFKDRKLTKQTAVGVFCFILYCVTWVPIFISSIFSKDSEWYHTPHAGGIRCCKVDSGD